MTGLIIIAGLVVGSLYALWWRKYRFPPRGYAQALCYHKISKRFCFEGTWTTPDRFFSQIDFLIDRGYRFIGEDEFLTSIEAATIGAEKMLLLTFDDGYTEVFDYLLPGLEKRTIPFHVFIVTDFAGRENAWDLSLGRRPFRHLSWREVEEMAGRGASFGSHGATHRDLTRLPNEECAVELVRSKSALEDILNAPVRSFSYPFGRYNDRIKKLARAVGYQAAFSLYPSHPNEVVDRFALRRNGVYVIDTRSSILRKIERRPFSWFEEIKCRTINGIAVLTPIFKNSSANRDR
ncbi:MAG: polysaccharide deacetylase family protein [Candidatus Latescibacteria bacterium]|nr:polysaccharide deacetylase family protein [Candidatus Latescibacterota bacterium]NIO27322.1 polysaccharide deacetylase family protein [Candidatus Latescibacterota bacterium]NIO54846.1 polysaccharide deacetylase family protein [Candidatus Latescibacterota bacterium]NIT00929.1 polysaccharide deacetylase family protein [Candidatus Latescibacterota bacterium]NIT37852.1 polysaccharide deacetylase family protein [Candidatus Latescibacterota bacterium]